MDIYSLSRQFFDWTYENTEKAKPNHIALYFFIIEHNNRLGWKEKFGLPSSMAKEAIGIKSYNTYSETFKDLVNWGFIKVIQESKNQFSSTIISISNPKKGLLKNKSALDKALIKHGTKHKESTVQSTGESIDSIDIQVYNNTNLPINNILLEKEAKYANENFNNSESSKELIPENPKRKKVARKKEKDEPPEIPTMQAFTAYGKQKAPDVSEQALELKYTAWYENGWKTGKGDSIVNWKSTLLNTIPFLPKNTNNQNGQQQTTNATTGDIKPKTIGGMRATEVEEFVRRQLQRGAANNGVQESGSS